MVYTAENNKCSAQSADNRSEFLGESDDTMDTSVFNGAVYFGWM